MTQEDLWHDTLEDALRAIVDALGGPKRVAGQMWPSKTTADAQRRLLHCLDSEREQKFALSEFVWLFVQGRAVGCHTAATFLMQVAGYTDPVPLEPEDERAALQREFVDATKVQERIVKRMEALAR